MCQNMLIAPISQWYKGLKILDLDSDPDHHQKLISYILGQILTYPENFGKIHPYLLYTDKQTGKQEDLGWGLSAVFD